MGAHMSRLRANGVSLVSARRRTRKVASGKKEEPVVRAYELQQREQALLDLLKSYPNQVVRGLAKRQEAEWHYGRLFLVGAITRTQYEAADYLDRVTRNYQMMIQRFGHVHAARFDKGSASTVEDLSKSARKRAEKVKKKYDEAYGILEACGDEVKLAIIAALRKDEKADLELIRRGLTVLSSRVDL